MVYPVLEPHTQGLTPELTQLRRANQAGWEEMAAPRNDPSILNQSDSSNVSIIRMNGLQPLRIWSL